MGFKNILRSIECYGIASVHGINYFGRGLLTSDKYVDYIRHDILGKDLLNTTINYVPSAKQFYLNITTMAGISNLRNWFVFNWMSFTYLKRPYNDVCLNRSSLIIKNQKVSSSVEKAIEYFDLMASYLDELRKLQNHVREVIGYLEKKKFYFWFRCVINWCFFLQEWCCKQYYKC